MSLDLKLADPLVLVSLGLFSLMSPMTDVIDSFYELAELFDTYIVSTGP